MKKFLILLAILPLFTFGKPKKTQFRIRIVQRGSYKVFIPEHKTKTGLFGKMWNPIEINGGYFDEKGAVSVIKEAKYEDSLRTIHYKTMYMYF